jgi:hypothetical protein
MLTVVEVSKSSSEITREQKVKARMTYAYSLVSNEDTFTITSHKDLGFVVGDEILLQRMKAQKKITEG